VIVLLTLITGLSMKVNASSTDIIGADVIHKQSNQILTMTDILGMYSSSLGAVIMIEDNYTGYGNILGSYDIMLYATDGVTAVTKTATVIVVANLGNVQAVTDYKNIHVRTDQNLTSSEIVYVLQNTGYVDITATTQMAIIEDTYHGNEETPGAYTFEFRLVNSAGLDMIYSSQIIVSDDGIDFVPDYTFEAPPGLLDIIWAGFVKTVRDWWLVFAIIGGFIWFLRYKKKHKKGGFVI